MAQLIRRCILLLALAALVGLASRSSPRGGPLSSQELASAPTSQTSATSLRSPADVGGSMAGRVPTVLKRHPSIPLSCERSWSPLRKSVRLSCALSSCGAYSSSRRVRG